MKPNRAATTILSTTRSKAKMFEFQIPVDSHIAIPRDPNALFSLAVGILGDVAAELADQFTTDAPLSPLKIEGPDIWEEENPNAVESLRFAATFFDAFLNSRLNEKISSEFSILCSCAYYIAGSVGSAAVIARQMDAPSAAIEGGLLRLTYAILSNDFEEIDADVTSNDVLRAMRAFFRLEGDAIQVVDACQNIREQVYDDGSPHEVLYSDLVMALCALKVRAASRTVIPDASSLTLDQWRPALLKAHFPQELWPAQLRICDSGLLKGSSAVVQMPTSAGKTRATELIIRAAFLAQRTSMAVIVAPFRSLCHDIRTDLSEAFASENILLNEATESYQFDISFDDAARSTVLIVTPEKLLYLIRRMPELVERIGLIIYDEGHQFEGMSRGPTYELLLSTLKMSLSPDAQVILISAVIGNASEISNWLIGVDHVVGGEGLLPTTKSIAFATWQDQRGQLQYVSPTDPDDLEFFVPRVIERVQLGRLKQETAPRMFPLSTGADVGLYLGLRVVGNGSVALFCGKKTSAANLCRRAAEIFERLAPYARPVAVSDADEIAKIAALTAIELGQDSDAALAAPLGVLGHHGDTPHGLRLCIEHAMRTGKAKFVVCTSTLAQGVNFPIKYLIVTATQQGRERIRVRDFHNLIGRAGRAGMHTEGSVLFSAPEIFDERMQYRARWDAAKQLLDFSAAEPVRSGILAIFDDFLQSQPPIILPIKLSWLALTFADNAAIETIIDEAEAIDKKLNRKTFGEFINGRANAIQNIAAYLVAHMTFDAEEGVERVEQLAANTLAYSMADNETRLKLLQVFRNIAITLRDNADEDFRVLIRKSPLPPSKIAALKRWLLQHLDALKQAVSDNRLLAAITPFVLFQSTSPSIKKLVVPAETKAIEEAFASWCSGESYGKVLTSLRAAGVMKGSNKLKVENAVSLCENGFGYDTAMIIASMADLAEDIDQDLFGGLTSVQRTVKCGLPNISSIVFFEAGFADRVVAQALANAFNFDVVDRAMVKTLILTAQKTIQETIAVFPSYFATVAIELGR